MSRERQEWWERALSGLERLLDGRLLDTACADKMVENVLNVTSELRAEAAKHSGQELSAAHRQRLSR